jgi:hypothetical protein
MIASAPMDKGPLDCILLRPHFGQWDVQQVDDQHTTDSTCVRTRSTIHHLLKDA